MRLLSGIGLLLAFTGILMFAEDNPAAGTWKLSHLEGVTPEFVHNGVLKIRPTIFTGPARSAPRTDRPPLYFVELSPDRRRLTLTQPNTHAEFKAVFDRSQGSHRPR
jgi:hypothetical protein